MKRETLLICSICLAVGIAASLTEKLIRAQRQEQRLKLTIENLIHMKKEANSVISKFAAENQALRWPAPGKRRVVFMGDSITAMWDLQRALSSLDYQVVNRAVGGEKSEQMLLRLRKDVLDLRPQITVILAGTCDILAHTETEKIVANLAAMIQMTKLSGSRAVVGAIPPMIRFSQGTDFDIRQINTWLRRYCGQGNCRFVDYYSVLLKRKNDDCCFKDDLHPNEEGYRIMTQQLRSALTAP